MSLLAVDIGNTNVHAGVRDAGDRGWTQTLRFSSQRELTADDWYSLLAPHLTVLLEDPSSCRVVACSVAPALTESFVEFSHRYFSSEPLMASIALDLGLTVATQHPQETGADRIVNATAAFAEYGGPVVVVDMGTATKIDAVTRLGEFVGGAIAPGLSLSIEVLASKAAQLYTVPLEAPPRAIGASTVEAVQAGVILGHLKMVDGLVHQIVSELGSANAVVITGGHANLIASRSQSVTDHRPTLTLDGLRIIASKNP